MKFILKVIQPTIEYKKGIDYFKFREKSEKKSELVQ